MHSCNMENFPSSASVCQYFAAHNILCIKTNCAPCLQILKSEVDVRMGQAVRTLVRGNSATEMGHGARRPKNSGRSETRPGHSP